jgi:hypothetical protein
VFHIFDGLSVSSRLRGEDQAMSNEPRSTTRRELLKRAAFVPPVILTLPVLPSFARAGSNYKDKDDKNKKDKKK